jgi:hypothetical protein
LARACQSLVSGRATKSLLAGKEILVSPSFRNPYRIFYLIRLYAVEVSSTILFLYWIVRVVWHELNLP